MAEGPDRERWARLQALFETALTWPVGDRDERLRREVSDPALRSEVAELLAGHESQGTFDDLTSALAATDRAPPGKRLAHPPERIGAYDVLERLGRGGMASVYVARRTGQPDAPRVALKILRRERGSDRLRRRFLAERQILARLRHPGIAALLDDGVTPEGLPYLVTELVHGRPIGEFCDEERLGVDDRLRLFAAAGAAVAHAHSFGIVHRDLKPANILVDERRSVTLLDFGIAKILEPEAFTGIGPTTTGVHLLTPRFASPEQLLDRPITPASDLYQLGLLLYQLLCGRLPSIGARVVGQMAVDDTVSAELIPPSQAVSGRGEVAADRSDTVDGLVDRLRGGLDGLVVRALAVDPGKRFGSAEELMAAIRSEVRADG